MGLKEFIETWIAPNTVIRLWKRIDASGHEMLCEPTMDWILTSIPALEDILVVNITDIVLQGYPCPESVNIVVDTLYSSDFIQKMIDGYRVARMRALQNTLEAATA